MRRLYHDTRFLSDRKQSTSGMEDWLTLDSRSLDYEDGSQSTLGVLIPSEK